MPRPSIRRASSSAIKKYLNDFRRGNSNAKVPQVLAEQIASIPEGPSLDEIKQENDAIEERLSTSEGHVESDSSPFMKAVVAAMQKLYPEALADGSFDNTGLLLEAPFDPEHRQKNSVLLTVDLTKAVVDEAIQRKDSVVVAYHPVIFKGLRALTLDDPQQQSLLRLVMNGISVYSPHTAVDAIDGGVADWLCNIVTDAPAPGPDAGASSPPKQDPREQPSEKRTGVDDVSEEHTEDPFNTTVSEYDVSTFNLDGSDYNNRPSEASDSSRPSRPEPRPQRTSSSQPTPSRVNNTSNHQRELSTSTMASSHSRKIIHPSSFFALNTLPSDSTHTAANTGFGRLVTFEHPQPLTTLIERISTGLGNPKGFSLAIPQTARVEEIKVTTVGICPGSGGEVLKDVISSKSGKPAVDLLFTGEMGHHDALAATERGISIVTLFHSNTERGYLHGTMRGKLEEVVREEWGSLRSDGKNARVEGWKEVLEDGSVKVDVSTVDRDPFAVVVLQDSKVEGIKVT